MLSYGLEWNESKLTDLSHEDMKNTYKTFFYIDKFINDERLRDRSGMSGIWEKKDGSSAVKVVVFDKKNDSELLPVMMIYKGVEDEFYKKSVGWCIRWGCVLSKVTEIDGKFEEVFKKRKLDDSVVVKLKGMEESKDVMKKQFDDRIKILRDFGCEFDSEFIKEWNDMIETYGCYYNRDLSKEIEEMIVNNDE